MEVEGDASSAAALFAAAAVSGGSVQVRGLPAKSKQPDLHFLELLGRMGCRVVQEEDTVEVQGRALQGIHADLADYGQNDVFAGNTCGKFYTDINGHRLYVSQQ